VEASIFWTRNTNGGLFRNVQTVTKMTKNTFISFSGGVESTTMCVLFGNKADAIFADTGYEFDELYKRIELVENEVRKLHGNNFTILHHGLDRMDNSLGYIKGNVCSCCVTCNKGKSNLSFTEWNDYLNNLVLYINKKRQ